MIISSLGQMLFARKEAWRAFAHENGGVFHAGSLVENLFEYVTVPLGSWTLLLDTNEQKRPNRTRIRVAFKTVDASFDPSLTLTDAGIIRKLTSTPASGVGHTLFDRRFTFEAATPSFAVALLSAPTIRDLCLEQPRLTLKVRNRYGLIKARFPRKVFELCFEESGREIHDDERLSEILHLFSCLLDRMVRMGHITQEHPGIVLHPGPDGFDGRLAWDHAPKDKEPHQNDSDETPSSG